MEVIVLQLTVCEPDFCLCLIQEGESQFNLHVELLLLDDGRHDILVEEGLALRIAFIGKDHVEMQVGRDLCLQVGTGTQLYTAEGVTHVKMGVEVGRDTS